MTDDLISLRRAWASSPTAVVLPPVPPPQVDFLSANPLRDGNEWLAKLMREPDNDLRVTALRIIETRRVFAESEFNWEICERVAREETAEDTLQMTKDFLSRGLEGSDAGVTAARGRDESPGAW